MKKDCLVILLWQISIFIVCFVFFTQVSPLIPYNGDDWYFTGAMRKPYPIWGVFNPIKVLPEVLEPFGGYIAAFLVYPFLGDYVRSISIVQSCIVSLFILAFCVSFTCFLVRRMKMTRFQAIVAELLFLLSFFIVYKHYGGKLLWVLGI